MSRAALHPADTERTEAGDQTLVAGIRPIILSAPAAALRLTVAHMIGGSALWQVQADPQTTRKDETAKSVAQSQAQAVYDAEKLGILMLLDFDAPSHSVARFNGDGWRVAWTFAKLLMLSDDEVMRVLTFVMAETLQSSTCVVEQIGTHLGVDITGSYTPDEAFCDLVRSKPAVNAMLAETGSKAVANANVSAAIKIQKGIIRNFLTGGNGREMVEGWLPGYFRFPLESYTAGGAGRPSDNARKADQFLPSSAD